MLHKIIEIDGSINFNNSNTHTLQTDSDLYPTLCGYSPFPLQEIYELWT